MLALVAAVAIFAYSGVLGYALITLTVRRRDEMLLLLAPSIGAAVIILLTMFLNYLGAPVRSFGLILAVVLLLLSVAILVRAHAPRPPRSLYPIALVLLGALLLTGRPFLEFGFDWLSYVNNDMNTYVHGAVRMYEHGFLQGPDPNAYVENRDAVQALYSLDVLYNNRTGIENLLAFWMATLRLDGYYTYMPLILSLHLTLIAAATALTFFRPPHRHVPAATAILLAVSPLLTLGTELQLIAQVCGLALMATSLALLCRPGSYRSERLLGNSALCGVAVAAFAAVYPEIAPLLMIAVGLFFALAALTRTVRLREAATWLAAVTAVSAIFLNFHISTVLTMLVIIFAFGQSTGLAADLFPQFLVPSGLPNLFGVTAIAAAPHEPILSWTVGIGLALLVLGVFATVRMVLHRDVASFGCAAFLMIVPILARHQNGFALFKLAMYLQPFLIPTLVLWWAGIWLRPGDRMQPAASCASA